MLYAMHKKGYDEWKQQIVDEYKTMEQQIIQTNQTKEYYQWVDKRIIEAHETYEFYNLINDKGKCIALSKCLYNIVSYRCNLDFIHNKEQVFQLSLNTDNKKPWLLYQEIKENAETYVKYWMKKNSDNFMHNVIDDLLDEYIEDKKEFESYCKSHKKDTLIIERNTNRGFGILKPLIVEQIFKWGNFNISSYKGKVLQPLEFQRLYLKILLFIFKILEKLLNLNLI